MFGSTKTQGVANDNLIFTYFKGLIVASLISLGLIILFAFCLKWFALPDTVIVPVNLAIKGASVLFGSMLAVRGNSKGLLKGFVFGIFYVVVAFVLFSLLAGTFSFDKSVLLDMAFAGLLGGIVGIIKVNKK